MKAYQYGKGLPRFVRNLKNFLWPQVRVAWASRNSPWPVVFAYGVMVPDSPEAWDLAAEYFSKHRELYQEYQERLGVRF